MIFRSRDSRHLRRETVSERSRDLVLLSVNSIELGVWHHVPGATDWRSHTTGQPSPRRGTWSVLCINKYTSNNPERTLSTESSTPERTRSKDATRGSWHRY